MEPTSSLFSITIDPVTKAHLSETARWARFLAIIGFIFLGLMLLAGVLVFINIPASDLNNTFGGGYGSGGLMENLGLGAFIIFFVISTIIIFFPLLYLLRFANRMKTSLNGNDQQALNVSFQNLKSYFRYIGIITIIVMAFYGIAFIFSILGAAVFA